MGSWTRHFNTVTTKKLAAAGPQSQGATSSNFLNHLPEVYAGAPNRQERYVQYENMDNDPFVNAALNCIAEFSTQDNDITKLPFKILFKNDEAATIGAVETLKEALNQWTYLNDFSTRMFIIFRKVIMYGDCIFIRDPETFEWMFVDCKNVEKATLAENKGKKLNSYFIKDLQLNTVAKVGTTAKNSMQYTFPGAFPKYPGASPTTSASASNANSSRFNKGPGSSEIDAKHVIHLSLNCGFDPFWPFGTSLLEPIFQTFRQVCLIRDALIIYRVSRAPARRVFKIDTGSLSPSRAAAVVERIKNEMQQRRIPSRTGGGVGISDTSYSPMSMNEDFFLPRGADGRGSEIDQLQEGQNLGAISDLTYFTNLLARGLGIPSSYLPTGPEDATNTWGDGKQGVGTIQELRFSRFCERIQKLIIKTFDREFKYYIKEKGIVVEPSDFQLAFEDPESFADYRQIEKDTAYMQILSQALAIPSMSKRFALERFGGFTKEEVSTNEKMWLEENPDKAGPMGQETGEQPNLRSVGITPGPDLGGLGTEGEDLGGEDMAGETPAATNANAGTASPEGGAQGGEGGSLVGGV